jgi:hypothetical protein
MAKRSPAEWPDEKLISAKRELIKLLGRPRNAEWPNWAQEIRAVRLELRKLFDRYPKAFGAVMSVLGVSVEDLDEVLPPRSSNRVSRTDLAQLLGDYRNARDLGWGRLDYLRKAAEDGWHWGGVSVLEGNYQSGIWNTPDAIEAQLKRAERLVKNDPAFAEDVDDWQYGLAYKCLGAVLWGRKNT